MITEMMAARAGEVASLRAVRPLANRRPDRYPHACYETVEMRTPAGGLNCGGSRQRHAVVRFFIVGRSYGDVTASAEAVKGKLLGWASDGAAYAIRKVSLADETDTVEDDGDPSFIVYVKSIDFAVRAKKL